MAKKKSSSKAARATRNSDDSRRKRRSDDELIADLQARLAKIEARREAAKQRRSPAIRAALAAVSRIDKGLEAAAESQDGPLRHALADARRALEAHLTSRGISLPKAKLPRGRRPKAL